MCCTAGNDELGDEGAIRIAEGLEKNTSLKKLDLYGVFPPLHSSFIVGSLTLSSPGSILFDVNDEMCVSVINTE